MLSAVFGPLAAVLCTAAALGVQVAAPSAPHTLLAEYLPSPVLGIDVAKPRFSWVLPDDGGRGVSSAAYQLVLTAKAGGVVWDSGKVEGEASNQVECGVALKGNTAYVWKVRFWSSAAPSSPSDYSTDAALHTGPMALADWHGALPIDSAPAPPPPPPPPPPPGPPPPPSAATVCNTPGACHMVSTTQLQGSAGYFSGSYNETQAHSVQDVPGCIAACNADRACVQITWAPSHSDKCVMYSSITSSFVGGAEGWVKASGQFIAGPGPSCKKMHLPPADTACVWFVDFKTSQKHFVSNCDEYPGACASAQKSCWPHFTKGLTIEQANASYIESIPTAATNYSCAMNNFAMSAAPPPAPAAMNPAELLRKSFTVTGAVESAIAFVSGVGWMDALINGKEVAPSDRLNPGRTNFDMRQWYMAYDVTNLVQTGENAVGVLLGRGWQSMNGHTPAARLMLAVTTTGGKIQYVVTDESWKGSRDGPIRSNNIYNGEIYDARMEITGWADAKFDDSKWAAAVHMDEFKGSEIVAWQPMNPIRQIELNQPLSITPIKLTAETVHVFKFPQNAAGWSQLTVNNCPKGTEITMYFSENLCGYGTTRWSPRCAAGQPPGEGVTGTVDQRNLHGNWANTYTCKGSGTEVYEPHFMYVGHRYVEVHGFPGTPTAESLLQRVVHSDVEAAPTTDQSSPRRLAGSIAFGSQKDLPAPAVDGPLCYQGEGCSAARPDPSSPAVLDQISHNVRWTLIDNLHSVPEDCDQR